jgi:type IV pilus assembly protein PilM
VDIVQLTPLALYNYMLFDQLYNLPPVEDFDPENPPPSIVILSLGTDATDLVVTNGYRVWQRSIPLGGNHFTKALTKGLKLTFAKAEHVKCNISSAKDPKVLFQAMRPVFNDLLTEVQRSIGYFTSLDRNAKISKIVGLGNAMKMPGLRGYLAKSLGMKVVRADSFRGLTGSEVLGAPAFQENMLCYGVCYGLAVQALEVGRGTLTTNLLPREIVKDRFIRGKKPWAIAAAAVLLLGCAINFAGQSLALNSVDEEPFKEAEQKCSSVVSQSQRIKGDNETARQEFKATDQIGQHLVGNVENRILWLELLRAINACLPSDPQDKSPKDIMQRNELHITNLECQKVLELKDWFTFVKENHWYQPSPDEKKDAGGTEPDGVLPGAAAPGPAVPPGAEPTAPAGTFAGEALPGAAAPDQDEGDTEGPQGEGWIVQLTGHHYHNPERAVREYGAQYVRDTFIKNLREKKVFLPSADREKVDGGQRKVEPVSVEQLGISYPVLIPLGKVYVEEVEDLEADVDGEESRNGAAPGIGGVIGGQIGAPGQIKMLELRRFDFKVQFVWKQTPPTVRQENMEKEKAEEEELARNQQL